MAEIFNIWLVDKGKRSQYFWGEGTMYSVGLHLQEYFNLACNKSNSFGNALSSWSGKAGQVKPHEVVIYFLQNRSDSIVAAQGGTVKHGSGATYLTGAGTISEVYLSELEGDANYSRLVANIAFHEALHNKLEPTPVADIHTIGGGGLSSPTVSRGMRPTDAEINYLVKSLDRNVPQYTLGM